MKNLRNSPNLLGTLLVAGLLTLAQSGFALKEAVNSPFSPILINGMPFYGSEITRDARGTLAVVDGDAISSHAKKVPFRAFLKRGDVVINQVYFNSGPTEGVGEVSADSSLTEGIVAVNRVHSDSSRTESVVEVSQVLAGARAGDKLIIESGSLNQKKVQRVINVAGYTMIRWFRIPGQPGHGC